MWHIQNFSMNKQLKSEWWDHKDAVEANERRYFWISWIQAEDCNLKSCSKLKFVVKGYRRKGGRQRGKPSAKLLHSHCYDSRQKLGGWLWSVHIWEAAGQVSLLILVLETLVFLHQSFLSLWPISVFSFISSIPQSQHHSGVRVWGTAFKYPE